MNRAEKRIRVPLDWSRLLGFDQADAEAFRSQGRSAAAGRAGVKLSIKTGDKVRSLRARALAKVGAKLGIKA